MTSPLPVIFTLGEAAEVAAYELLRGAMDADPRIHRETVEAVHALPADLSILPAEVAACLAGLRRMGDWNPGAVKVRILARCPLAASSHDASYPLERVKPIAEFVRQNEAEYLLSALRTALLSEGVKHPETVRRCRALLALLGSPTGLNAQQQIEAMARALAAAKDARLAEPVAV